MYNIKVENDMKKVEFIERYGEEAWEKKLEQGRAYYKAHREETKVTVRAWRKANRKRCRIISKNWRERHSEKAKANSREGSRKTNPETCRKGGKYYEKHLIYEKTGLRGERNRVRDGHGRQYYPFKMIIAPDSQIHHEWIPETANYRGLALVEKDPHQYGIIDVILILDGEITLLTEEEVKNGKKKVRPNVEN